MAGHIQKQDVKTLAELEALGASKADLINDTQIYMSQLAGSETLGEAMSGSLMLKPRKNIIYVDLNGSDTTGLGTIVNPYRTILYTIGTITDSAVDNQYLIHVGVGEFVEGELVLPPYVSMEGTSIYEAIISPATNSNIICDPGTGCELSFLTLKGAGAGYAGISCNNSGVFVQLHKVVFEDCDVAMELIASSVESELYGEFVEVSGNYHKAVSVISTNGVRAYMSLDSFYTFPSTTNTNPEITVDGSGAYCEVVNSSIKANTYNDGILVTNGGAIHITGTEIADAINGVYADTTGNAPVITMNSCSFEDCVANLNIANTTTIGSFFGLSDYAKNIIGSASFFIANEDTHIITVGKSGCNFASIAAACNVIADSSITNRYIVSVGPGVYTEPVINVPEYVSVSGQSIQSVVIQPAAATHNVFNISIGCEISFLSIKNAGSGFAGISAINVGNFARCHKISFYDCDIGIYCEGSTIDSTMYAEYVDFNGTYTHACYAKTLNGYKATLNSENVFGFPTTCATAQFLAENAGAHVSLQSGTVTGTGNDTACESKNGAILGMFSIAFAFNAIAIHTTNSGAAPNISASSCVILGSISYDMLIEHPGTTGFFTGSATQSKVSVDVAAPIAMSFTGSANGTTVIKDIYQGGRIDRLINMSKLLRKSAMMGLVSGGAITISSGRILSIAAGSGFAASADTDPYLIEVSWDAGTVTIPPSTEQYIYITSDGAITSHASKPNPEQTIHLGRAYADANDIDFVTNTPVFLSQYGNKNEEMLRNSLGAVFGSGCIVSENVSVARQLDVTGGSYYYGTTNLNPIGGTSVLFEEYYKKSGGGYSSNEDVQIVSNTKYDDGSGTLADLTAVAQVVTSTPDVSTQSIQHYIQTINGTAYDFTSDTTPTPAEVVTGLAALINADGACVVTASGTTTLILTADTSGVAFTHSESANLTAITTTANSAYYAKHSLYVTGDPTNEKYFFVYSQSQHESLLDAQGATIPVPPTHIRGSVVLISTIITQKSAAALIQVNDDRPRMGFKPSAIAAVTAHGDLTGLGNDDHTQYLKANGTRPMSGALNMGSHAISNVGLVDDVTVSAHAARHLPTGADPLTTAAGSSLSANTTNAEGTANSLSRSDHTHSIGAAAAVQQLPDQTNAEGNSANFARANHIHNIPSGTPTVTLSSSSTNDKGAAASFALSDHSHAVTFPSNPDPLTQVVLIDDFLGCGNTAVGNSLGWATITSGTGAMQSAGIAGETGTFGVTSLTTGSNSGGRATMCLAQNTSSTVASALHFGQGLVDFTWRIRIPTLSTSSQRFKLYAGFGGSTASGDMSDGVYFTYTDNANTGLWVLSAARAGTRTTANTAVSIQTTSYVNLRIIVNADGTLATFYIDDVSVGTIATNIPIAAANQCSPLLKIEKSAGSTARLVYADLFKATINFTVSR